jgi:hypothetical protein
LLVVIVGLTLALPGVAAGVVMRRVPHSKRSSTLPFAAWCLAYVVRRFAYLGLLWLTFGWINVFALWGPMVPAYVGSGALAAVAVGDVLYWGAFVGAVRALAQSRRS